MANQNNQQLNAWQEAQSRVIDLCKNASPEDMTNRVPACPEWTAHDLLAHMVGVGADLISEAGPSGDINNWTQGHVDKRNQLSPTEILNEWQELNPQVEQFMQNGPEQTRAFLLNDLIIHEQDLRGALKEPGEKENEAMTMAANTLLPNLGKQLDENNLPAINIEGPGIKQTVGSNPAQATLRTNACEVTRMITGRRSPTQIQQMNWDGDPNQYMDNMVIVGNMRQQDLIE